MIGLAKLHVHNAKNSLAKELHFLKFTLGRRSDSAYRLCVLYLTTDIVHDQ
jgi:hypothetical protein